MCRASYIKTDWQSFIDEGRLTLLDGDCEIVPGVRVEVTGGHTLHHQIVRIESGGASAVFLGDLVPTRAHVTPHFVMAYDLYPMVSFEAKQRVLAQAVHEGSLCFFYHDPEQPSGRIVKDGKRFLAEEPGS